MLPHVALAILHMIFLGVTAMAFMFGAFCSAMAVHSHTTVNHMGHHCMGDFLLIVR